MKWTPIINQDTHPDFFALIVKKLTHIAEELIDYIRQPEPPKGLMDGTAGISLFLFYYGRFTGEEKYADLAAELWEDIFVAIDNGLDDPRISSGLAGIAWTLQHLIDNDFVELEIDEFLDQLNPFFDRAMIHQFQEGNYYDYLHGALGSGMFWLSRLREKGYQSYLNSCIHHLDRAWPQVSDPASSKKGVNLGTAHGIPSIIGFLTKALESGNSDSKTLGLIDKSVNYLLTQTIDPEQYGSYFPYKMCIDKEPAGSRLAWCYGDLGIGAVLWRASRSTNNNIWEKKALQILTHSTTRKKLQENLIMDACFCHGTAGNAHIYNRMYRYTGKNIFKESAHYWLGHTLNMAVYADGAAGFKVFLDNDVMQNSYGLLDGIAGIGMVLMAAISDIKPAWDSCFFLS
jgi:lantibiotic modifying enzyme